jgi:hypothetical protein
MGIRKRNFTITPGDEFNGRPSCIRKSHTKITVCNGDNCIRTTARAPEKIALLVGLISDENCFFCPGILVPFAFVLVISTIEKGLTPKLMMIRNVQFVTMHQDMLQWFAGFWKSSIVDHSNKAEPREPEFAQKRPLANRKGH